MTKPYAYFMEYTLINVKQHICQIARAYSRKEHLKFLDLLVKTVELYFRKAHLKFLLFLRKIS